MELKNVTKELEKAQLDEKAGIKLALITGDSDISAYAAEIASKTELNPHFHKKGIEIYQILEGRGVMKIGDFINDSLHWTDTFEVKAGDCFSIPANKIHQIINNSNGVLRIIFICPSAHLGKNRYFIRVEQ